MIDYIYMVGEIEMALTIKKMIETSFLDWDGKIVTTLYVPNCNFRCPYCHNWPLFENPDEFEDVEHARIFDYLEGHRDFIDGICLTGGEPTLYPELEGFLGEIKKMGFQIKLDTNGSNPELLEALVEKDLVDYVAMDIKTSLDERYDRASGVKTDLDSLKKSIGLLMRSGIDYEFRTTVVPTIVENKDVNNIAEYIKGAKKLVLQQFVGPGSYLEEVAGIEPFERQVFNDMVLSSSQHVEEVLLRGNIY